MASWTWIRWLIGVIVGFFGGMTILVISSFYLSITFKPLVVSMDFGTKRTVYGIFGQFGNTPITERGSEEIDLIFYGTISLVAGYSHRTSSSATVHGGRKWQLVGFVVGNHMMAAYQTVGEINSGIGAYILKRIPDPLRQRDVFIGYIIANDSTGAITRCPYLGTFDPISIADAESQFPSIKRDCDIITFSR